MPSPSLNKTYSNLEVVRRDTLIKGQPSKINCVDISGKSYTISNGPLRVVGLEDEWYDDVEDPAHIVSLLKENSHLRADIFTFWQRYPDIQPKYEYHMEWVDIAVLPLTSFQDWWDNQIKSRIRNLIRKSEKAGVSVKSVEYDDDFVQGMVEIFNESPIRQGRRFWHYGKDFDTVKKQFSKSLHREDMIGAYLDGKMIGFIMLGNAGKFALTGQIISSIHHRDKATNNALIAKAVEVCEQKGLSHLIYLFWSLDSLSEFKRRCGFEKIQVPKYFVPLTSKGKYAIKYGLHKGWKEAVPNSIKAQMKRLRRAWNERKSGDRSSST